MHITHGEYDEDSRYPETKTLSIGQFKIGLCHGYQVSVWFTLYFPFRIYNLITSKTIISFYLNYFLFHFAIIELLKVIYNILRIEMIMKVFKPQWRLKFRRLPVFKLFKPQKAESSVCLCLQNIVYIVQCLVLMCKCLNQFPVIF